jgi:hypothetical protein
LVEKPAARDAAATSRSPPMNTRRRPRRSASLPPSSRKPPKVSTYAFTTQGRFCCEKSSPLPIDGSATLTIDASSTTMNWAKQRRASAIQRRRSNSWAVVIIFCLLESPVGAYAIIGS